MAGILFTNFARSQLAAPLLAGDLSLTVQTGHGARFPAPGVGDYFYLVLENASLAREIVKCTGRAVDTLTIVRAQDNTTALGWNAGDVVALRFVAAAIADAVTGTAMLTGAAFTGPVSTTSTLAVTGAAAVTGLLSADGGVAVPAGETGANAPQAQETALLATTQFGYRNKVLNGNFAVNQRVVSGSVVLAAGAYGHDMWKAGASGCTYTFAASAGVTTLTISAGSLVQPVDGDSLQTGTYTLSWTGTAQGKIGAGAYSATGVTGAVTGGANTTIEFNTGTLSLVQLEPGAKPTVYEFIGKEADLHRCEPYYEIIRYKANGNAAISSLLSAGADYFQWSFRRVKKSAPTITLVSGAWVGGTPTISVSLDGASFLRATGGFNASGVAGAVCLSASSPL